LLTGGDEVGFRLSSVRLVFDEYCFFGERRPADRFDAHDDQDQFDN